MIPKESQTCKFGRNLLATIYIFVDYQLKFVQKCGGGWVKDWKQGTFKHTRLLGSFSSILFLS